MSSIAWTLHALPYDRRNTAMLLRNAMNEHLAAMGNRPAARKRLEKLMQAHVIPTIVPHPLDTGVLDFWTGRTH